MGRLRDEARNDPTLIVIGILLMVLGAGIGLLCHAIFQGCDKIPLFRSTNIEERR